MSEAAVDERQLKTRALLIITGSVVASLLVPLVVGRVAPSEKPRPPLVGWGAPDIQITFRDGTSPQHRDDVVTKCASIPGALNEPDRVSMAHSFRPVHAVIGASPQAEREVLTCLKADAAVEQVVIPS